MTPAPFHAELAQGPTGAQVPTDAQVPTGAQGVAGRAVWVQAQDGLRLRIGIWADHAAPQGTILMLPGRTEYVEKYGQFAADMAARGFACVAIDWRGQGLSDRLLPDRLIGHIGQFTDYQQDFAAMLAVARAVNAPQPWFLIGHSMGGGIGLRSVIAGAPVAACAFSGPMWGIKLSAWLRPFATAYAHGLSALGQGNGYAPSTADRNYVLVAPFADNVLTTDRAMWDMLRHQITAVPDLELAGPSVHWVSQALRETARLHRLPAPDLPCLTFVGSNERIIDVPRVHHRMARWPKGRLVIVPGAEHEVLMEGPATRARVADQLAAHFTL